MENEDHPQQPELYTPETIVFAKGVKEADTKRPISVYKDSVGNHSIADGNHRGKRAYLDGELDQLGRTVIGTLRKDVSKDPNYNHISEVKIQE